MRGLDRPDFRNEGFMKDTLLEKNNASKGPYRWFTASYFVDWAIVALLMVFLACYWVLTRPRVRFFTNSPDYSYPLVSETVPVWMLIVLCVVVPLLLFVGVAGLFFILQKPNRGLLVHEAHNFLLTYLVTVLVTLSITQILKVGVGRYRPNFDRIISKDAGSMSFPSGHSSWSFCVFTLCSLYLCGKLRVFTPNGGDLWKTFIAFSPMSLALFIATTRLTDYYHHFSDVTYGSGLGMIVALIFYNCFFNSLFDNELCGNPKLRIIMKKKETLQNADASMVVTE